ncbi:MAG: hypothetical protein OXR68_02315 [Alphaproteobacteria bacterium]|nr:hypothetical protein [Alphaproteobacteria bacterium]MDD9919443.1 hypothetical protein [Alphaproteobacteria bacterium]
MAESTNTQLRVLIEFFNNDEVVSLQTITLENKKIIHVQMGNGESLESVSPEFFKMVKNQSLLNYITEIAVMIKEDIESTFSKTPVTISNVMVSPINAEASTIITDIDDAESTLNNFFKNIETALNQLRDTELPEDTSK